MKRKIIVSSIIIVSIIISMMSFIGCSDKNDVAEKKNKRSLTIINATGEVINEIHVTVGDGTEIESMARKNPDAESLSIEIPKAYDEYTEFNVILVDRYGLNYQKEVAEVALKGRTEVKITQDDYVEEKGDFWNKVDKFFNGD